MTFPIEANCYNADHVKKVVSKQLDPRTLKNSDIVSNSILKETQLDTASYSAFLEREEHATLSIFQRATHQKLHQ